MVKEKTKALIKIQNILMKNLFLGCLRTIPNVNYIFYFTLFKEINYNILWDLLVTY